MLFCAKSTFYYYSTYHKELNSYPAPLPLPPPPLFLFLRMWNLHNNLYVFVTMDLSIQSYARFLFDLSLHRALGTPFCYNHSFMSAQMTVFAACFFLLPLFLHLWWWCGWYMGRVFTWVTSFKWLDNWSIWIQYKNNLMDSLQETVWTMILHCFN